MLSALLRSLHWQQWAVIYIIQQEENLRHYLSPPVYHCQA
jgi:hypothetical protein